MRSQLQRRARMELAKDDFSRRLATLDDPAGGASEAYRTLRASLLRILKMSTPAVVVLTSPGPKEGKSTTCANLGVALAQAGHKTLIMDCDLRGPLLHKVFGLSNSYGLVDVLTNGHDLEDLLREPPLANLNVVTAGPIPPNPTELLGSGRFSEVVTEARERFDYVLLDSPHLLAAGPSSIGTFSDPLELDSRADGVLLVLDAQGTTRNKLRKALQTLESAGSSVLGLVVNNVEPTRWELT
ncbi:MAG TPA: CpsD/CapB family tyrosine-protein kinase [Rubrobacter sp.]|nr:CpsD/CapB family tyrosine-protein kinase [Rubrobacter sp.]